MDEIKPVVLSEETTYFIKFLKAELEQLKQHISNTVGIPEHLNGEPSHGTRTIKQHGPDLPGVQR